ncbi:hypothetical protein B0H17DRAFT_1150495 [Mycena rosella]|uniref:Uncharacterized protein n=1 Tax=Mycena rosella TaxID=1033263 RepID=A0AAD7FN15_MYCRO|nr:hypothetical protein B0H17DRAFT_1150495 [Mycena rosella]
MSESVAGTADAEDVSTMAKDPYDVDSIVRDRGNFRLLHCLILDFVDHHAVFWAYILISPRVSFTSLETSLINCAGNGFALTIRLDDLAVLEDEMVADTHPSPRAFARAAVIAVLPYMSLCSELFLQAANAHVLDSMLSYLRACRADALTHFTVTFALDNYFLFEPPSISGFQFASIPLYGRPFSPMTIFSVIAILMDRPTITFFSTPSPANAVALEILHLCFEGSRTMAYFGARLVLPRLKTVQITFSDRDDLECVSLYPHILNAAPHVVLAAAEEFFEAFHTASGLPCPGSTVNWNACPVLEHLVLRGVHVVAMRTTLLVREALRYPQVATVLLEDANSIVDPAVTAWFSTRSISLTVK